MYYYQGLAREGMKLSSATESYREYLKLREKAGEDPLVPVLKKKLAR